MMFAAPPEQSFEWGEATLEGTARFLKKLWTLVDGFLLGGAVGGFDATQLDQAAQDLRRKTHETLQQADDDYGRRVQFNTVVSAVMELCNDIGRFEADTPSKRGVLLEALRTAVLVISPIAPHIAHALWRRLGETTELLTTRWPDVDEAALTRSVIELVVQVNGKVRGKVEVDADADNAVILSLAKSSDNVARHLQGKTVRKEIVVPNKLVNIVVA
jgi:leucyl-tRNA synthetase